MMRLAVFIGKEEKTLGADAQDCWHDPVEMKAKRGMPLCVRSMEGLGATRLEPKQRTLCY